tara:strand:+ start:129 stop:323 length:195 start_codon:yes stop_codon:yes gene_type:complete
VNNMKKLSLIKADAEELIIAIESNIENITVLDRENEPVIQLCFIIEEIENLKRALGYEVIIDED